MRYSSIKMLALTVSIAMIAPGQVDANPQECQALAAQFEIAKPSINDHDLNNYVFKAADKGCVDLARQLLAGGGSVIMRRQLGETALHHAAQAGEVEVAKLLLAAGAELNQRDLRGSTALFLAAENNHTEMVKLLLGQHADATIPGRTDVTPLSAAAFNGNDKIVDLLLSSGSDPKAIDRTGKAAILYAANRGFAKIVERLLTAGVDVNAVYGNDLTALMWASGFADDVPENDAIRTVTLLLDKGAKLEAKDDRGYTALITAAQLGHDGVVKLLVARGANKAATNKDGNTAADLAPTVELKTALAK